MGKHNNTFDSILVRKLIDIALAEDLPAGDVTSDACVPVRHMSVATIRAKQTLVVCGLPLLALVAQRARRRIAIRLACKDGRLVKAGTVLAKLQGRTRDLLALERTMLNFLQHLSAVATVSRRAQAAAEGLKVLDTRKTTPGWRSLEKYAVKVGGACNHRASLSDMVLVKNNHIDANAGNVRITLQQVFERAPRNLQVEVEVRSLAELSAALEFRPHRIMLDNFSDAQVMRAMRAMQHLELRPMIEVSGGVQQARLKRLKRLGVDCVSMGALTTQAGSVDISMRIESV
ncbi:MAG: carboxylating nicotinate-nucleotide diphosphorylase [Oligoflexia bacterium]|nr:carboxylating nicotinate-nucleotide diphosphorylase [Oligoflexia bacterium]